MPTLLRVEYSLPSLLANFIKNFLKGSSKIKKGKSNEISKLSNNCLSAISIFSTNSKSKLSNPPNSEKYSILSSPKRYGYFLEKLENNSLIKNSYFFVFKVLIYFARAFISS